MITLRFEVRMEPADGPVVYREWEETLRQEKGRRGLYELSLIDLVTPLGLTFEIKINEYAPGSTGGSLTLTAANKPLFELYPLKGAKYLMLILPSGEQLTIWIK
ncbi:MAG TPA: hypothetical protein PLN21_10295 [Gemmatales bacterium]|nr:hypothetical protein [Gemmatales bacterium]